MLQHNLHAIEVLGTMLFRRSGNGTHHIIPCTVVTGKCSGVTMRDDGSFDASISTIAPGLDTLHFAHWFREWDQAQDTMSYPIDKNVEVQGRTIEVAIATTAFNKILESGSYVAPCYISPIDGKQSMSPLFGTLKRRGYGYPIVAIKIDGHWTEPIENLPPMRVMGLARHGQARPA